MSTAGVTPSGQMIVKEPVVKQEIELGTSQMPALSSAEMSGGEKQPELSKILDESEIIDKEPDMPKIVGHLKKDLDIEPVESLEKRERSGSSSSSSSSSSSDSESDGGQKTGASETSAKVVSSGLPTEISKDKKTTQDFNKEGPVNILPGEKSVDATKPAEKKDDNVEKSESGVSVKDQPLETSIDQPKEVLSSPIQESSAKVLPFGKDSSVRVEPSQPGITENIEEKVMPPIDNAIERHGIKRSYSLSSSSSSSESDSEGEYDAQKHVSVSAPDSKIAKIPEESELGYKEVPSGTDIDTTVTPSETKDTVDTKLVTKPPGEKKEKKKDKGRKSGSSSSSSESEGEPDKQKDITDKSPVIDSVKDKTKVTKTPEESEFGSKEVPGGADVGISVTPDQSSETKDIVDSKSVTKPADGDKKKKKDRRSGSSSSSSSESDSELKSSPLKEPKSLESKDQMNISGSPIPIIKLTEAEPIEDSSSDEGNVEVPKDKVVKEDASVTKPSDKDTDKPKDTDTEKPNDTEIPKDTYTPSTYKPDDTDKVKKEKQPDIKQKDKIKDSKKDGSSSSSSSSESESDSEDKSKEKQKSTDVGKSDKSGRLETDLDKVVSTEPEIIEPREGVQVERQERFEIVEGRAVAKTVITISSKSKDDDDGEKAKIKDISEPEQEKPFSDSIKRKDSSSSSSESEHEVDDVTKQRKDQAETKAEIKETEKMVAMEKVVRAEDKMEPDDKIQKTVPKKEKTSIDDSSSSSSSSSESENGVDDARRVGEIELMQPVTETMISSDMNEPSYAGPSVTFVQTHRTTIREEKSGSGVPDVFQVERSERFETMDDRNITHRKPQKSVSFESSVLQFGPGGAPRDQSKGHMDTEDDDGDLEELAMTAQEYLEQDDEEFPDDYQQQYSEHGIKQQSFDYTEDGKHFILCLK